MPRDDDLLRPQGKCLLVLLPGLGDRSPAFKDEGIIAQIRKSHLSVDLIAADASPGYYAKGVLPLRLEEDVLKPARARGYQQVWLAGISMGGFGTVQYASRYPDHVDGLLLLSPWLGRDTTIAEIEAAGGLMMWKPPPVEKVVDDENFTPQAWGWVARVVSGDATGPELYLGYGDTDARVGTPKFLADALKDDHVFHAPGGHDWPTWHDLLGQFLAHSTFVDRCRQ